MRIIKTKPWAIKIKPWAWFLILWFGGLFATVLLSYIAKGIFYFLV